jgi:hypothetical protein
MNSSYSIKEMGVLVCGIVFIQQYLKPAVNLRRCGVEMTCSELWSMLQFSSVKQCNIARHCTTVAMTLVAKGGVSPI